MRRGKATRTVCAVVLVAAGSLIPVAASTTSPRLAACGTVVNVPHQGASCFVPGIGWRVLLADGTSLLTHGGDPAPPAQVVRASGAIRPMKPACVTAPSAEFHLEVLYVHASDRADRYLDKAPEIRAMVLLVNGMLRREAASVGRVMNYRVLCSGGEVYVAEVTAPTKAGGTTFKSIVDDLRAQSFASPTAKYMIWYDGHPDGAPAGLGSLEPDHRLVAENANNYGSSYAVTFGEGYFEGGATTMMHENGHNMGAVQGDAPHTSGAGHCTDGQDIMCYSDGGPGVYNSGVCSNLHYDCHHDDYFNPNPPSSNYLYSNWNIGSPLNRFLSGCMYATGTIKGSAAGQSVAGVTSATVSVPRACSGHSFALSGTYVAAEPAGQVEGRALAVADGPLPPGVGPITRTSQEPGKLPIPDFDVCWYHSARLLKCFAASTTDKSTGLFPVLTGTDRGSVPSGATKAVVIQRFGANGTFILNAV